jgi:hypothetical protein
MRAGIRSSSGERPHLRQSVRRAREIHDGTDPCADLQKLC